MTYRVLQGSQRLASGRTAAHHQSTKKVMNTDNMTMVYVLSFGERKHMPNL